MKKSAPTPSNEPVIRIRGARQNNLKNLDLDLPVGGFTVVTGLSGSGKSSLVFDTLYAEGQRRYVETFSPYARQFLDRMDRPHVDEITGVPPAIAIDQTGSIRTSRSTVGTMTEINDHLKLLFAQQAKLFCPHDGAPVRSWNPDSIWDDLLEKCSSLSEEGPASLAVAFRLHAPKTLPIETARAGLSAQGFTRILEEQSDESGTWISAAADRFRIGSVDRSRALEAIETALEKGAGELTVYRMEADRSWKRWLVYSRGLVCPECGRRFREPHANAFSFNSPLGACEACRGFGRIIETDWNLVIPDPSRSLAEGAVRPFETASNRQCKEDLLRAAKSAGIDPDCPFEDLPEEARRYVIEGDPEWSGDWKREWYGVKRFFEWLESKSYKMHVRVLLSRYRSYVECPTCRGSHLKSESLSWRYGAQDARARLEADGLGEAPAFPPPGSNLSAEEVKRLPGFNFHELMRMPIARLERFFAAQAEKPADASETMILDEIRSRLRFLAHVGLGYLTLDRQGRTLSGGEVQRVNLTTALGTNLVNTLFVLDEPSIGLHPRDMHRVNGVLRRLSEAGNTLVVVEHDPQVMLAADRLVDLGPGAGKRGGEIVYDGPTRRALDAQTLTGLYLSGRRRISRRHLPVDPQGDRLRIEHADLHNLKRISVDLPLGRFIAVAGVSGSGKSTLVIDTLVPKLQAMIANRGRPVPGLSGGPAPGWVVYVDQSPLGRTTRGNPASYIGAFDPIRSFFGSSAEARAAGFSASDFSFNTGRGRCPRCSGSGYELVEMQFLSDVYLPCPECAGKRFRREVLDIAPRLSSGRRVNISDILEMTVDEASSALADDIPQAVARLRLLQTVGLGYLTLGQPLTTLSGGERQRLKLTSHMTSVPLERGLDTLYVFDEPTTGLHFADIEKLVEVFDRLVALGHTVVVIEHNLDMIGAADWVIELGPDGGDTGGEVVFFGTPEDMEKAGTLTGRALRGWREAQRGEASREEFFSLPAKNRRAGAKAASNSIEIEGAREHNLKNLSLRIPRDRFTVVTGPSGSGKSTLAFDIVFAEGQRRYLESLNAYARSMVQPPPVPDVDAVRGIPPTVAIEQRTSRGGMRSTVATLTEIYHFLRLIFVKLGVQHCPNCGIPIAAQNTAVMAESLKRSFPGLRLALFAPFIHQRKGIFRAQLEALAEKSGVDWVRIDGVAHDLRLGIPKLARNQLHDIDVFAAVVDASGPAAAIEETLRVEMARLDVHSFFVSDEIPGEANRSSKGIYRLYSANRACPFCAESFPELDSRLFSYNTSSGACPTCSGYGVITEAIRKAARKGEAFAGELSRDEDAHETICPECRGARLNAAARHVFWKGMAIQEVAALTVEEARRWFESIKLDDRERAIAADSIGEISSRLRFLEEVGLGYLTLDRSAPTLSGGEAQRIRLAAQLGTNLRGVCYVLDEPTIGLHPRDNAMLLGAIEKLSHMGNTLLVVEHDEETIRRADHVIDIGPSAGRRGGELCAEGTVEEVSENPASPTGRLLRNPLAHSGMPARTVDAQTPELTLKGVRLRNLDIAEVKIPLNRFIAVTGVSGSGKSTFSRSVLFENLSRLLRGETNLSGVDSIEGADRIARILEVDQTPIGKTPRSCPATYVGFYNAIRNLFAGAPEAAARGYTASRFSFNNADGACPHCKGQGMRTIEMAFLPDVKVLCEVCGGSRFNPETLAVTWKGKTIGEVLRMEVDEAAEFFAAMPAIARPLRLMQDVGLGYLTLGQPSPTLSGGEAQRIKLVTELSKAKTTGRARAPETFYVLDEPTVGLHMADVAKLTSVLGRLVDAGNTVLVVEHNLDVVAEADWVIDLGPEGGSAGGRVVAEGTPAEVARAETQTGRALRAFLEAHRPRS